MARSGEGRPTTDDGITLDIRHLTRAGLVPERPQSGTLQWTWPQSGQPACHIAYDVALGKDAGTLRLAVITRFDSFGRAGRVGAQTIDLITTTPPYGGRRWWFLCPSTGRRVMKPAPAKWRTQLCLPTGSWPGLCRAEGECSGTRPEEGPQGAQADRRQCESDRTIANEAEMDALGNLLAACRSLPESGRKGAEVSRRRRGENSRCGVLQLRSRPAQSAQARPSGWALHRHWLSGEA